MSFQVTLPWGIGDCVIESGQGCMSASIKNWLDQPKGIDKVRYKSEKVRLINILLLASWVLFVYPQAFFWYDKKLIMMKRVIAKLNFHGFLGSVHMLYPKMWIGSSSLGKSFSRRDAHGWRKRTKAIFILIHLSLLYMVFHTVTYWKLW